ncbi:MAG: hypothetical protein ACI9XK_001227 [Granulosicoccus sp.]|jgi:hypothetical protein
MRSEILSECIFPMKVERQKQCIVRWLGAPSY